MSSEKQRVGEVLELYAESWSSDDQAQDVSGRTEKGRTLKTIGV